MTTNIEDFQRQADCVYKNEHYSVRDNGAVFRHPRQGKQLRKHDNHWTFGTPNNYGYLLIAAEVVHRIVAYAFLGEPPSFQHIVDHIDTNRQNNRPQNLRWLTKLENILTNPITVKKIIFRCGSIEAFLNDPSILKSYESDDSNFSWMRTVTPEEAQASWKRLSNWAKTKNSFFSSNQGSLGDWVFKTRKRTEKERIAVEQTNHIEINDRIEFVLQKVERDTGLRREEFSSKTKKQNYLNARVYAAKQLRLEIDLSEERISQLIGVSKSMVNTYLNHTESFLKHVDYYTEKR